MVEGDGRHLKESEAVLSRQQLPDDLPGVSVVVSVEQLQQAPVLLSPALPAEVEDEGDLPALQFVVVAEQGVSLIILGAEQVQSVLLQLNIHHVHDPGSHLCHQSAPQFLDAAA